MPHETLTHSAPRHAVNRGCCPTGAAIAPHRIGKIAPQFVGEQLMCNRVALIRRNFVHVLLVSLKPAIPTK